METRMKLVKALKANPPPKMPGVEISPASGLTKIEVEGGHVIIDVPTRSLIVKGEPYLPKLYPPIIQFLGDIQVPDSPWLVQEITPEIYRFNHEEWNIQGEIGLTGAFIDSEDFMSHKIIPYDDPEKKYYVGGMSMFARVYPDKYGYVKDMLPLGLPKTFLGVTETTATKFEVTANLQIVPL